MAAPNPVEKRLALMRALWLEATADPQVRVVVWRVADNAERMVIAFLEAQRADAVEAVPDLFLRFDQPFETGFTYSRALCDALIERYVQSADSFKEQGVPFDWPFARVPRPDSAAGFIGLLGAFAAHHRAQFRSAVAALMPAPVNSEPAFEAWLRAGLAAGLPEGVRLVLVETEGQPRWEALLREHAAQVRVLQPPLDLFDIARETAAQSPGSGPSVAYRQLLTDVLLLVQRGTPAQVSARADKAMAVAQRERWLDQQVVLHAAVAGAHLKAQDVPAAVARYRQARVPAEQALTQQHPAGPDLLLQTWFGEAGAWLMARQHVPAAECYRQGALVAQAAAKRMMALEGFRMAAFCMALEGQAAQAREWGALAVREGKAMAPDERPASTLGLALHDQLRLQDAPRAGQLEALAEAYRRSLADAQAQAETQAKALGPAPAHAAVDRIEAALDAKLESAFDHLRAERERVIGGGDAYFRQVVTIGRELLHPHWAGQPEVKHPLDKEQAMWTRMPESMPLAPAAEASTASQPEKVNA